MWSSFENSPLEDETISNIFSSRAMFKIRSEEQIDEYPMVQASVQNKHMVIVIDKSIVLVEEDMETKCSFLSFNSNIDAFAISQSGHLIVCGLSNGEIHGVFIKGVPLFNLCVKVEDTTANGRTFSSIQEINNKFFLLCTNGSIYALSDIDETCLMKFSTTINDNETIACDESIFEYIKTDRLCSGKGVKHVDVALLAPDCSLESGLEINSNLDGIFFIGGTANIIFIRSHCDDTTTKLKLPEKFGCIKRIFNIENYILVLTNSGHLLEVCPITKTICLNTLNKNVLIDELIPMEANDDRIELLILTKKETANGAEDSDERLMKFVRFPDFKCLNEFEVPSHSWIVQQPKCAITLYYLRGVTPNRKNLPTEIEMVSVSETDPSDRFKKLIARGHLEEAEDYGKHFELCLQPVYEGKAKSILVTLTNLDENNPELLNERFEKLLQVFTNIEDQEFFKRNRMMNMPSRRILERFLNEMLKRLDNEQNESHALEIREQLRRLETLFIIDPYECDGDWQKFVYSSNMIKYLTTRLKKSISTASLIWKRHSASIVSHLDQKGIQALLTLIPNNTEAFNLLQWLRQFLPIVGNTHPAAMPFITDWVIKKTRSLQFSEHWPEIGLEFSTKILKSMEEIEFIQFDVRRQNEQNIAKLRELVNALQDLSVLEKSFNLILTLDNYQQESLDDTAFCLLQRVNLEHIQKLVNDFLYPIFHEQGKSPVVAIRRYVTLMVGTRNTLSTWLQRAVACIELLHNEDDRMKCALSVLQSAPVPWPETVAGLIKLRFSTHPLASKIDAEYEKQAINIMKAKYGWPAESEMDLSLFMFRIVKMDLPGMFDDLRSLIKAAPELRMPANFNCLYRLVINGRCDVAYEYFKRLNTKSQEGRTVNEMFEWFAGFLENEIMLADSKFIQNHKHFIEFFKLITPKNCNISQKRLSCVKNRFTLFHRFNLKTKNAMELFSYDIRTKLLEAGVDQIIVNSRSLIENPNQNIISYFINEVKVLTSALEFHMINGVQRVGQQMKCLPLTCALAYAVLESSDCNKDIKDDFINLALEILVQQILIEKRHNQKKSAAIFIDHDPLAFPLAYEFLANASLHEKHRPIELMELIKFVKVVNMSYPFKAIHNYYGQQSNENIADIILKTLKSEKVVGDNDSSSNDVSLNLDAKPTKKRVSVSVFDEIEVNQQKPVKVAFTTDELSVMKFVARTLLVIVLNDIPKNYLMGNLRRLLIAEDATLTLDEACSSFFSSLEHLVKIKVHDVWYTMAQYVLQYQRKQTSKILSENFVRMQMFRVLRNLLSQNECNFIDLFAMLMSSGQTSALFDKLEHELKTDQEKFNFLTLQQMYAVHLGEESRVEVLRTRRLKHYYYMEFCKLDPSIKGKFMPCIDNIDTLLKEFRNKQLDVYLLERISRDFDLDLDDMLVLQIISILKSQEMLYELKTDSHGEEEFVMLTTVEQLRSLCQPYIDKIQNTESLTLKLKILLEEINIYFYEMYLCVIEILAFVDSVPKEMEIWTSILQFLKHKLTRRRSRPGQLETDIWLQSQSEICVLPKIARYRLPFKPIVEKPLKDILDNELNVDNCESWFPLIELHTTLKGSQTIGKMRDYFCMTAAKNSISEYKAMNDFDVWHIQQTNNAFLKSILRLVAHVQNPSKAFMILYFVASYAPEGADQVEATYECYKFGLEHEAEISDEKYQEQLQKIKRKYPILKTQHLLHIYGLSDEKLLHLVENPTELIYSLYNHELILKPNKLNINNVIKQIAELHNINLEVIQLQLIQKWLLISLDSADGTVLEETFFEDHSLAKNTSENSKNTAENALRAHYILDSWPKEQAAEFLIAQIFPPSPSNNTSNQLQMYECMSKLNEGNMTAQKMLNQKKYIAIKCVHELKQLGYNASVKKFENCNKIDILKAIWQRNAQDPHALEILANICIGYDIYLAQIWNGILKRMVMFNMVRQLNSLVDALSCQPKLLHVEGFILAWEYVLQHPFRNANKTRSPEQEEILQNTLFRLQGCPVLEKLNLLEFAILCSGLARPHLAAVLLSLTKNENHQMDIKKLILPQKNDKLRKEILELEDVGILPSVISHALKELKL